MPPISQMLGAPSRVATSTDTAATVTATQAAPAEGNSHFVTKLMISASAVPAAAVTALVKAGANTLFAIQISTAQSLIVVDFGEHPLRVGNGVAASLEVPSFGPGITVSAQIFTFQTSL